MRDWEGAIRHVMPPRKMKDNKTQEIVDLRKPPEEVEAVSDDRSGDDTLAAEATSSVVLES